MITASIVTFKTDKNELEVVLECLLNSVIDKIYIIDNSPTDELRPFKDISAKIIYYWGHGNIGYGSGHNIALEQVIKEGGLYHLILNSDIVFDPTCLIKLIEYMDLNNDIGQLMPKIIYPNGETQYLCRLLPTPLDLFGRRFLPFKKIVEKRNFQYEMRSSGYTQTMEVPFLSGCFMFCRVDVIQQIRGFDDAFFMYCEDIDFCRRVSQKGYRTMYYPEVEVIHAHKKESFKSRSLLKAHIKSAIYYFSKWGWFIDSYRTEINKKIKRQYN